MTELKSHQLKAIREGSTVTRQRERFSQCPAHRISRFDWQHGYDRFIEVLNSYRTWIKASAG